ncbi:FUSC family protein [Micromonospora sp. WMMD812]|uniref:FUSC family protein n=1 Tax=Micromonospora sp. WMMD812 TaxID=3015152 RepID=UPI00248C1740|nr:FUSC family protein [Micromonospora sp. WMMD812]WBB69369.1 FUSC family protein [Micromonospora sp. WMMD812]
MLGTSLAWLRRRDPGYVALRRAARLTIVASTVFYTCRYALGSVNLATYGLFGTVAAGAFAQLPGSARERARTLLAALPVAWALVAAGTVLAANTWAAAGGMLVIGFAVAFAGVGGPRLVGLVSALQLFYILASFPPSQPSTLPERLGGVSLGIGLIAAAEMLLWPDPAPVSYQQRLADAAGRLSAYLEATAAALTDPTGDRRDRDVMRGRAAEAVDRLRLAQLPPVQRPTGAGARDRTLRVCGAALTEVLAEADRLAAETTRQPLPDGRTVAVLGCCADTTRAAGAGLLPGAPPADVAALDASIRRAEAAYPNTATGPGAGLDVERLRRDATALAVADQVRIFAVGARLAGGTPVHGEVELGAYREVFDDARRPPWVLYWRQFRSHLSPWSAPAQSALRLAVALAAARVVAGSLDLMHGFWVLLATLTILRTSAVDTRTALRPAVLGTTAGAVVSGLLMLVANPPIIYAVALPVTMVLAFTIGRLWGAAWAQAMFTLLLTFVFAQLAPPSWRLAEARLENVLLGAAIGVLAGVVMWPRGATRDLSRNTASYLAASGDAVIETVEAVLGGDRPGRALARARRAMGLADASYNQYHSERHDPWARHVDWEAALAAGHQAVYGAEALLARNPPGALATWPDAGALLRDSAGRVRSAYDDAAERVTRGGTPHPNLPRKRGVDELGRTRPLVDEPGDGRRVRHLVEVDLWLDGLADRLARLQPPAGANG